MSITELSQVLGNFGEFVGAIAVVATLVYLAIQVRHSKDAMEANTRSLEESRKLEMAHAYQARADQAARAHRQLADSEHLAVIRQKLGGRAVAEAFAVASLSPIEEQRWAAWMRAWLTDTDNLLYQYQQGFLDQEYFESNVKAEIRLFAPMWDALDTKRIVKPTFDAEVERILAEAEAQS